MQLKQGAYLNAVLIADDSCAKMLPDYKAFDYTHASIQAYPIIIYQLELPFETHLKERPLHTLIKTNWSDEFSNILSSICLEFKVDLLHYATCHELCFNRHRAGWLPKLHIYNLSRVSVTTCPETLSQAIYLL